MTVTIAKEITFTAIALRNEQGRRKNNKSRAVKARPAAWYFASFGKEDFEALTKGERVVKSFGSGKSYGFQVR